MDNVTLIRVMAYKSPGGIRRIQFQLDLAPLLDRIWSWRSPHEYGAR
jgi:hypothetical protein